MGNHIEPEGTMRVIVSTSRRRPVNVRSACSSTETGTMAALTTILELEELRKDTAITKSIVASTYRLLTLDQESEGQTLCWYYAGMLMPGLLHHT